MNANEVQMKAANAPKQLESSGFEQSEMEGMSAQLMAGPDSSNLKQLQAAANGSNQVSQLKSLQAAANASPQVRETAQLQAVTKPKPNISSQNTDKNGLPEELKIGIENLSGMDMSGVKVHYNSSKPASLGALAYAQGLNIYVGAGQEHHLPHEAWHVVQQKQGRVKANAKVAGEAINNDRSLEKEADQMGAKALQKGQSSQGNQNLELSAGLDNSTSQLKPIAQRVVMQDDKTGKYYSDMDPSVDFDTYKEAADYETEMDAPDPISGGRAPTLYTYMSTKSHCKISGRGIPQGPHSIGYSALTKALFNAKISLENLIAEQVSAPDVWIDLVVKEFGDEKILDGKTETSQRLLRAYRAYNGLWQLLQRIVRKESDENPIDVIHELIQLSPFAVYGYVNPSKITKKHLKAKGENSDLSDPKNIDRLGKFKNKEKYQESIDDRLDLLDDDFVIEELSSDSDDEVMGGMEESSEMDVNSSEEN